MVGIKRRLDYNCAMKVLREFGLGILYAILLPILLAIAAVVAVYGVFNFLIEFVIMVVNFFKGEKLFPLYKEDRQAMDIYQKAIDKANGTAEPEKPATQNVYVQQNFYATPGMANQMLSQAAMMDPSKMIPGAAANPQLPGGAPFASIPQQIPQQAEQPKNEVVSEQTEPEKPESKAIDVPLASFPKEGDE